MMKSDSLKIRNTFIKIRNIISDLYHYNGVTSGKQLVHMFKELVSKNEWDYLKGIPDSHQIKDSLKQLKKAFDFVIANNGNGTEKEPYEHWVLIMKSKNGKIYYFDSFNRSLKDINYGWSIYNGVLRTNNHLVLEKVSGSDCGEICVAVAVTCIYLKCDISEFLNAFKI